MAVDPSMRPGLPFPIEAIADGRYVTGEDNLRLTCIASSGPLVLVEGRLVTPDGCVEPFSEFLALAGNYATGTKIFPLREGLLIDLHVRTSSAGIVRGECWAVLELVRGREGGVQPLATLLQGYVTTRSRLAWPPGTLPSATEGTGKLRYIGGNNPAAGAEISEQVPTGAKWRVKAFSFTLVTSAAVANRAPVLTIDDGGTIIWQTGSNVFQTATQTAKYFAASGVPLQLFGALSYHLPLPADLWLSAGSRIRTLTGAIDVGDDYAAPLYLVEEFLE